MKTSIIYILFFFISSFLLTFKVSAQTSIKKDSITSSKSKAKLDFKVHTDSLPQNNTAYVDNMLGFALEGAKNSLKAKEDYSHEEKSSVNEELIERLKAIKELLLSMKTN